MVTVLSDESLKYSIMTYTERIEGHINQLRICTVYH